VLLNAVPYVMAAGAFQVTVGTLIAPGPLGGMMVIWADALRL
jgi:hypothetical protein